VTSKEIGKELQNAGIEFDRKKIDLEHPIKSLGETKVPIKLHPNVTAEVTVIVEREASIGEEGEGKKPETGQESTT